MNLKNYLHKNPKLKKRIHRFIMHPVKTRPYWWIRILQPIYIKKGKGAVIYRSVRKDLPPFHQFRLGKYSVIEDYSCLNNAVGDIITKRSPDRIRSQLPGYHQKHHRTRHHHLSYPYRRTYHYRGQRDCTARCKHWETLLYRCRLCGN